MFFEALNKDGLFQYMAEHADNQAWASPSWTLAQKATFVVAYLDEYAKVERLALDEYARWESLLDRKLDTISFYMPELLKCAMLIPASFSALVVMQNQIVPLLKELRLVDLDCKRSLHKFCAGNKPSSVSENLWTFIQEYWETCGKEIREFRDLDNHWVLAQEDFRLNTKDGQLHVILPDDPTVTSSQNQRHSRGRSAVRIIRRALMNLSTLANGIMQMSGAVEGHYKPALSGFHFTKTGFDSVEPQTLSLAVPVAGSDIAIEGRKTEDSQIAVNRLNGKLGTSEQLHKLPPPWDCEARAPNSKED